MILKAQKRRITAYNVVGIGGKHCLQEFCHRRDLSLKSYPQRSEKVGFMHSSCTVSTLLTQACITDKMSLQCGYRE
jgi:hypothetical protein